jgi:oligosaccharide repeat unit polymerase
LIDSFFSIDNPAVRIISDMGTAMKTVAFTLELVPRIRPFDLGLGYGYAFLAVIPNLFWGIHPTAAHGLAADWLVWAVAPGYAALGGGFGFSFIAEAYLNFGWLGIAPVLGLVGFLFGKLVMWAQGTNEPVKLATAASFLAFFLLYARGEAGLVVRPLIWYALLPYILVHVLSRLKKPHARSKQEHMVTTEV